MVRSRKEESLASELARLSDLDLDQLRSRWQVLYETTLSNRMLRLMLMGGVAYRMQEDALGGLPTATRRFLERTAAGTSASPPTRQLRSGTVLLREWQGVTHQVTVLDHGLLYRDRRYRSLSAVARQISGIHRSGPDFFGLKQRGEA